MYKIIHSIVIPALIIMLASGCRNNEKNKTPEAAPRVETVSSGPVSLTMIADPPVTHLDRDILLTIRVVCPSNIEVCLPPIENRLKGFTLNGAFTRNAASNDAQTAKTCQNSDREYCFRLTPTLSEEYRIAPMAVTWLDRSRTPPSGGWFMTKPLRFEATSVMEGIPPATIHDIVGPVRIYPPFKTVALRILAVLGIAGIIWLIWWSGKRIHRAIILRRMSPKERALYELNELLAQHLVEKHKVKEFYLEITMIVRRYIERAHGVRAPEQTTEEFLADAAKNPDFTGAAVARLRAFLQTADLVKFAALQPEQSIIDQTVATARDYILKDETPKVAADQNPKSKIQNPK